MFSDAHQDDFQVSLNHPLLMLSHNCTLWKRLTHKGLGRQLCWTMIIILDNCYHDQARPGQTSQHKNSIHLNRGSFVFSDQYLWSNVDNLTKVRTGSLFSTDTWSDQISINIRRDRERNQTAPVLTRMKVCILLALAALALAGLPRPEEARDDPQPEVQFSTISVSLLFWDIYLV